MAEDEGSGEAGGNAPDAIDAGKAQKGAATATGQEAARRAGAEDDLDKNAAHEGQPEVAGGEGTPDYVGEGVPPQGAQTEPAQFVGNGALDKRMVATPSGPQPVAAVARDADHGQELLDQREKDLQESNRSNFSSRQRISEEKLASMGKAEIRAVASDRGYDISDGLGGRGTRSAFLNAQNEDQYLDDEK